MNNKWLVIFLFISLSFNMAVLGSFIYFRFAMTDPHGCPPPPPDRGGFPPDRHMRRDMFDEKAKVEIEQKEELFRASKDSLFRELSKDKFSELKARALLDSSLICHTNLERTLGNNLIKLRKTMSTEEAKNFFDIRRQDFNHRNILHRRRPR